MGHIEGQKLSLSVTDIMVGILNAVDTTLRVIESGFAHIANQPTVGLYYLRVSSLYQPALLLGTMMPPECQKTCSGTVVEGIQR